ncbi:lipid A biosynthesis (KDO)2-(lauroyl)-lipid IVA acyltransferase [uncultured Odoribacter sp.]|uniref:LpxL/LpxP family acyltransferase n=1 Tax=uncultured Odoribacter sp. TaxID=876416 RepID=UPI00262895F3|nr:lipid A biosynthesis (KDO)2-(lauroyl)-lipid IVA acyltransferase [uncultured Odoribacter sp.]
MQQREWKGRTGGGNFGQRSLFWFFRYVDVRFGYLGLRFIVVFYMIFARKRCMAIFHYFRQRQGYSYLKSWWKTYRNHYLFGQTVLDKFAIFSGNGKQFRVTVEGQEYFKEAENSASGCLIASAHVGNFEIAGYLLSSAVKPINGVIFGGESPVMQQYRSEILNANHIKLIPVTADMSHIYYIHNALKNGEFVCMPCDRIFSGNKKEKVDFLGAKAEFPAGFFYLGERLKTAALACFVMKEGSLHYRVYIRPLKTDVQSSRRGELKKVLAVSYVQELEKILKCYPEQWYNFYEFWK